MKKKRSWIITTNRDRPIRDISNDLVKAGLVVDRVLEEVGCITGSADDKDVPKLRKVRGVADCSPDAPIHIGPPDSPETW